MKIRLGSSKLHAGFITYAESPFPYPPFSSQTASRLHGDRGGAGLPLPRVSTSALSRKWPVTELVLEGGDFLGSLCPGRLRGQRQSDHLGHWNWRDDADPCVRPQPGPRFPDYRDPRALRSGLRVRCLLPGVRLQVLRQAVFSQASSGCLATGIVFWEFSQSRIHNCLLREAERTRVFF